MRGMMYSRNQALLSGMLAANLRTCFAPQGLNCYGPTALFLAKRPWPILHRTEGPLLAGPMEQEPSSEENQLLARLRLLSQIAQIAAGELDLPLRLSRSLCELERHFPLHTCPIWLADFNEQPENGKDVGGMFANVDSGTTGGSPVSWILAANNRNSAARAVALGLAPGRRLSAGQTPFCANLKDGQALYADLARL